MHSRKLGTYQGRAIYRWRGVVELNGGKQIPLDVVSPTAGEACDLLYDLALASCVGTLTPFDVTVFGVKGGRAAHRYAGFDSLIMHGMGCARRDPTRNQLNLGLPAPARDSEGGAR